MIRWSHAALNCADLATTERFYTTWFGFRRTNDFTVGNTNIVFLRLGDAYLELFNGGQLEQRPTDAVNDGPQTAGSVRHIAFQTDDVEALLSRMGSAARVTLGPLDFDTFIPGWRTVWLTDPDGVVVEITQGYRDLVQETA
jgi:glyoxylase I family protein